METNIFEENYMDITSIKSKNKGNTLERTT